ncbi:MAG: hypothetical protein EPO09_03405 [Aquabacterium sp.]|uniref:hypothetical protein n=1 Tax=Aquabacterium sp. TaxID=1872578 RepID=UPI0012207D40|nr:hypothetical protein [Aquabacterium sp.]TAK97729.1 MAG: hypothetical protein EPO09_03405 [Aquabacterium sp.]
MNLIRKPLLTLAVLGGLSLVLPAQADTTISGSISDSISTAVGSVSTSIKKSSQSSTKDDKTAAGDYRVVEMAALDDQPGMTRLKLQATADQGAHDEFYLLLPQKAVDKGQVREGSIVTAQTRPFGVAFAAGEPRQPFFLVMEDQWYRELASRPVVL